MDSSPADLSLFFIKKFDHFLPMIFNNRASIVEDQYHVSIDDRLVTLTIFEWLKLLYPVH